MKPSPGSIQTAAVPAAGGWNAGGWFGGLCGPALLLPAGAARLLPEHPCAALAAGVAFLVVFAVAWGLWRRRGRVPEWLAFALALPVAGGLVTFGEFLLSRHGLSGPFSGKVVSLHEVRLVALLYVVAFLVTLTRHLLGRRHAALR